MTCSTAVAVSLHLFAGDWNAIHPSVRCEQNQWSIGAFYNSERRVSVTAGYTFDLSPFWIEAGAATGYSYADVVPFIRLGAEIAPGNHFYIIPTLKPGTESIGFVVGLEHRF